MVRVVACHTKDPGSNPVGPKVHFTWNYFSTGQRPGCANLLAGITINRNTGGSDNLGMP